MTKFTDEQLQEHADIIEKLREAKSKLETSVSKFNDLVASESAEVQAELDDYNELVDSAEEFRTQVVGDMNEHYYDKSDKWQESEKGQAYLEWISDWDNADLAPIEIEFPDPIDEPELHHDESFGQLATELP